MHSVICGLISLFGHICNGSIAVVWGDPARFMALIVTAWAHTTFPELRADRPYHQPGGDSRPWHDSEATPAAGGSGYWGEPDAPSTGRRGCP
jgi:hypothetical protein